MEGTCIFTGTVNIEPDTGKVYLTSMYRITDINAFLEKFTGEMVEIRVSPPEMGIVDSGK